MKTKIYIKQWLDLKPQNYNGKTDVHYLKIANKIYSSLENQQKMVLLEFMAEDDIVNLCCFLTCYFEDIISQTNIWHAFKSLYRETYNKPLPFYPTGEDYLDEEINVEDVAFLIWYYLNTIQEGRFVSPYNDFIFNIGNQVMQILDDDYEFAPENKALRNSYQFNSKHIRTSDEFYETREFLQTVFFESYLFYPDIKRRLDRDIFKTIEKHDENEPHVTMSYVREVSEDYTFSKYSTLLALKAKDWARAALGKSHEHYKAISSISQKVTGLFFYKSQTKTEVTLEHIASGMLFGMTKKSFDKWEDLKEDKILYIGLVRYKNEWWFSGNFAAIPFKADIILDQKNSAEARMGVNFLEDKKRMNGFLKQQEEAFLDFNKGSLVAFLDAKGLNAFVKDFTNYFNDSLKLSSQDTEDAHKRAKEDGYFGGVDELSNYGEEEVLYVLFFNPNSGIETYDDIVNAFPDERNPFFSGERREDVQHILMSNVCSTEFTNYFIEHYKDQLEYFKNEPYKSYLNDLDFLLKFWKRDNYKTKSIMVLTGERD